MYLVLCLYSKIFCGILQGSILGPLLLKYMSFFKIYVSDMADALDEKLLLYANGSVILISDKDVNDFELLLEKELVVVSEWLINNKLSLHLGKQSPFCLDPNLGLGINLS